MKRFSLHQLFSRAKPPMSYLNMKFQQSVAARNTGKVTPLLLFIFSRVVQLETPNEGVLGRITAFSSEGQLASCAGEEFNIRAVRGDLPAPEDLREHGFG
jgi:hypothetical protein